MKNVLLLAMSTLPNNIQKDNYYQYQNGEVFTARSQLEPITHMLSEERKKKGEKLDKIVILETDETMKADVGKVSAVDFYKERVNIFTKEIEYIDIPIDENKPAEGIRKATTIILKDYKEQKENQDKMNLWIDTQGGFRDVVMVFNAIISLLREQGIEPRGIYSIRYDKDNTKDNPCPIIDQTKKYDIFKFVSAMQEFMDFGKATGFKKYYGEESDFVQAIESIADAIQMCQPQEFEEALQKFADYLKSESYKNDDPYLQIFIEFMKNDYSILLREPENTVEQIRWCVRKEFYQQAVTIYIEKMPKYYHDHGIVVLKVDDNEKINHGKNPHANAFYTELFEEMLIDEKDEQLKDILYKMKTYVSVNDLDSVIKYLKDVQKKQNLDWVVQAAINKLIDRLQEKFDACGIKKKNKSKGAKTIQEYIDIICSVGGRGNRSELLYGRKRAQSEDGYERKIRAIIEAKSKKTELVKMMEYYLAMKLLRNRMNHASEEDIKEDEQKAVVFLKSERIDIGIEIEQGRVQFDYQKIKKLIIDGLECVV